MSDKLQFVDYTDGKNFDKLKFVGHSKRFAGCKQFV
jgi:hypothetical protein